MFPKVSKENINNIFDKFPKKKGKTIGNPPKIQQMPYNPRKENKHGK
jgi:hypothetical protein